MDEISEPKFQKNRPVYNGKRTRKSVTRKVVDFANNEILYSIKRMSQSDTNEQDVPRVFVTKYGEEEEDDYADMMPPKYWKDNCSTSVCGKFAHSSVNKVRYPVNCAIWTPDGRRLITGLSSGEFSLWNGTQFNFETILKAHDSAVRALVWSHNDDWLISGDNNGEIKYWQPNMNNMKKIQAHKAEQPIRDLSFSPTDLKLASASDDQTVKIWDFATCELDKTLKHGADVKTVHWHPSLSLIASGTKEHKVKIWEAKTGKEIKTFNSHKETVLRARFHRSGNYLVTVSRDYLCKLFDMRMMSEMQTFKGHTMAVTCVNWHPFHDDMFVTGAYDHSIKYWKIGSEEPVASIETAHEGYIWDVAFHPVGHILASASNDQTTKFWVRNRPGNKVVDKHEPSLTGGYQHQNQHHHHHKQNFHNNNHNNDNMHNVQHHQVEPTPPMPSMSVDGALPGLSTLHHSNSSKRMKIQAPRKGLKLENSTKFSIMSYNILSNTRANTSNFLSSNTELLSWGYRSKKICLELLESDSDIICLQEVEHKVEEFFIQTLKNYTGRFSKSNEHLPFGVFTFVKKNKFKVLDTIDVPFTEKNFVGTLTVVSFLDKNKLLIIGNVLFAFEPNYQQNQQSQVDILVSRVQDTIKQLINQHKIDESQVAVMLCGDYNFMPYTSQYNSMLNSPLSLASAYGEHLNNKEPDYTVYSDKKNNTQDFIFFSSRKIAQHSLLSIPKPPSTLPSKDYSSDHFHLYSEMEF